MTEIGDRLARFRAAAALARAVDSRDVYTGSHSERVAAIAGAIAEQLDLPATEIELTRLAGSLHDLGKLAIPEEILQKPGELTTAEWLVVQRHPQIAHRMLESLGVEPVADWVLHHHERWDGAGYPDGLAGEDIPLGSRIVYVAEVYDAMTFGRLYRAPRTREAALEEIDRCAGAQFDPEVVRAFFSAVGAAAA
jgi:HD-GYP domain-containing protein (c-di-GMP phosphodiesterase class II)